MYPYVYSRGIHNSKYMETTEIPINRQLDKEVIHICNVLP